MNADPSAATVRQARPEDRDAVVAFTNDTWEDRESDDYIPRVFDEWVETDGPRQRTFVVEVEGPRAKSDDRRGTTVAGICRATLLSEYEAWVQGMRVHPDYRGLGLSTRLNDAAFAWARERGATVARNMVFSWNVAGLGGSRAAGFDPGTEFRWARPTPDADATPALSVGSDPDAAWTFWGGSDARTALRGLVLDAEESWALSELTRKRLHEADADGRLLTVRDDGTRAFAFRNRTYERDADSSPETWAEYAVAAWADLDAATALFEAVARDAASVDVDRTRVLVPEGVEWVSDVAAARVPVSEEPDFVMEADLTREEFARE